jgi:hypothetical protein
MPENFKRTPTLKVSSYFPSAFLPVIFISKFPSAPVVRVHCKVPVAASKVTVEFGMSEQRVVPSTLPSRQCHRNRCSSFLYHCPGSPSLMLLTSILRGSSCETVWSGIEVRIGVDEKFPKSLSIAAVSGAEHAIMLPKK